MTRAGDSSRPQVWCLGGEDLALRLPFLRSIEAAGLSVVAVGSGPALPFAEASVPFHGYPLERTCAPLADMRALRRVAALAARFKPAIIHGFDTKPSLLAPLAVRISGEGRAVRTINGLGRTFASISGGSAAMRSVYCAAQKLVAPATTAAVFQNRHDLTFFEQRKLLRGGRAHVIPGSGVDIRAFSRPAVPIADQQALRCQLGIDGQLVVSCVTRMTRQKGIPTLLLAADLVARERDDVKVLLVGPSDGEGAEAITAEEIGRHAPHVLALGPRDDVARILAITDVFAFPSAYGEGVPRSLLEAGAMGTALVTTNVPGCTDVVTDGWNGLVIEPGDPCGLASAVLGLLANPDLRGAMGERSRRRVAGVFSLESVTAAHLELYERVLAM